MAAPQAVLTLVEKFERNLDAYRGGHYNETQVRRDFIDPFFMALGWDMDNSLGYAEAYRDVVHEDTIKVGISTRAPDYSFRVGGQRKFFLEAKKPSVNVKADIEPAFQLRRYAWSAKLPLSIVTDFEEFAIYDCRQKPDKNDKASKARLFYCTFGDYAEKWDEIAAIFSKDAVLKGSFDKYAVSTRGKRGTTEVDSAFLEEIEHWRILLARNIALRNHGLTQRELNFAVQQTIDRIIFLRICEDRGIESYGRLMALQNGVNVYDRLRELFREADDRYNSGLFHFKREKGREEAADELTLTLQIDDRPLKEIFKNLYYPDCPYEFSVLGADILGSVYEQFLGKVIRLSGNRALVEDKPEVKKAGGVYYTPAYIVDYIVAHTVGKLLEGKSARQAAGITVLDPACGSGSFLIGAYQYLLDWYLKQYVEDGAEKHSKGKLARLYQGSRGAWRLTTAERKRILLEHIYGVDIDTQAVEVTKLSLLLKVLEGESGQTLNAQMKLFHERVLPDLAHNIQCGNSLIGPDFYEGQLDLDDEAARRINMFDWQAAFPQVFERGGFDAVIGNPPYVRTLHLEEGKDYYKKQYSSATGAYDIYVLFMEVALRLVKKNGTISFITPNKYFVADYAKGIRFLLSTKADIIGIVDLGRCKSVFPGASISTAITIFKKALPSDRVELTILSDENVKKISQIPSQVVPLEQLITDDGKIQIYADDQSNALIAKLTKQSTPLSKVAQVRTGVMGFDYWEMDKWIGDKNNGRLITTNSYISRYKFLWGKKVRLYKRNVFTPRLDPQCDILSSATVELFETNKIVVRGVAKRLTAMIDEDGIGLLVAVHSIASIQFDHKFLLSLLNSTLFNWLHVAQFYSARIPEGSLRYPISFLSNLPIPTVALQSEDGQSTHDKLVELVEKMLALHQQLAAVKTPQDTTLLQRQIDVTDRQIDQLVYTLYGLTDKEIGLVEDARK